jgi:hypothetical protein
VRVSAVIVVVLLVLLAVSTLLGANHGPGRHFGHGSTATDTQNVSASAPNIWGPSSGSPA